jgi:hypothetical protein
MANIGRAERRLKYIVAVPYGIKVARLVNRLAIRTLGVQIINTSAVIIHKDWFDKLLYSQGLFALLKSVEGDVVGCGVAGDNTLSMLVSLVRSRGISRHIYGFGDWSGLPAPSKQNLTSKEGIAKRGLFDWMSPENMFARLRWHGFKDSEISKWVTLVKGQFSDALTPGIMPTLIERVL